MYVDTFQMCMDLPAGDASMLSAVIRNLSKERPVKRAVSVSAACADL